MQYRIGSWKVAPDAGVLMGDDHEIHLTPREMDLLVYLAERSGEVVTIEDILETIWTDTVTGDYVVYNTISSLRKALKQEANPSVEIKTISKKGYQLVASVEQLDEDDQPGLSVDRVGEAPEPVENPLDIQPQTVVSKKVMWGFPGLVFLVAAMLLNSTSREWVLNQSLAIAVDTYSAFFLEVEVNPGIAVLPFTNLGESPKESYFSDGIAEEILNELVEAERLPVIARASSFQFKDSELDAKAIGKRLGVTRVLEGSVRRLADDVRIAVRLVDAESGANLWSYSVDGKLQNIFELQNSLSNEIVAELDRELGLELDLQRVHQGISKDKQTSNLEAYDFYLKGLQAQSAGSPQEMENAIPMFEKAIALDPEFADAWTGLGMTYTLLASPNQAKRIGAEVLPIANNAFRQALSNNPEDAVAMAALGLGLIVDEYNWREGVKLLEAAVELAPENALVLGISGFHLLLTGDESANRIEKSFRLDPLNPDFIQFQALQLLREDKEIQALALIDTALIANKNDFRANYLVGWMNAQFGQLEKAKTHLAIAKTIVGHEYPSLRIVEYLIADRQGDEETAIRIKGEIYSLMQSEPMPLAGVVKWNQEEFVVVFERLIQQKSLNHFDWFRSARHPFISEEKWKSYQSRVNYSEAGFILSGSNRTEQETTRLLTEAHPLSEEQLSSYVGTYRREHDDGLRAIRSVNGRLEYSFVDGWRAGGVYYLVPTGEDTFEMQSRRITVTFGRSKSEVDTMTVTADYGTRVAARIDVD